MKFKWIWKFEFELKRAGGKLVGPKRFEIAKLGPATHLVRVGLLTRWVPHVSVCLNPNRYGLIWRVGLDPDLTVDGRRLLWREPEGLAANLGGRRAHRGSSDGGQYAR